MKSVIKISILIFVLFSRGCNTTEPPPDDKKPTLTLSLDDTSCTEVWLQLTTKDLTLPAELTLKQYNPTGDSVTQTFSLSTQDFLLYIDSLLPNQTYQYQVSSIQYQASSIKHPVTTMDTTSHNFTWQTFEFGQHSSSVLYDVAIINENNIWAVGEIYMNDSLGNPDPTFYNAVHWDGNTWVLKRILYQGGIWTIKTIYAFNENDIWFSGYMRYYNGNFIELIIPSILQGWSINKLWGTSSSDLYAVGNEGNIAHYNGSSWTKIESGTNLDVYDIWGNYNTRENKWDIFAVAAKRAVNFNKIILKISNNIVDASISTAGIPQSIYGIWFNNKTHYIVGSGIYRKKDINSSEPWMALHEGLTNYYIESVRGNDINDVMLCGSFGELLHFNGLTWKSYQDIFTGILLGDIAMKDNVVVTVGFNSNKAFIALGQKY
jgi:hypothetical protein